MSNDPWRNARVMYEKDTCARKMGIELIEMDDGFAQMSMTVSADMLNGHQTCHGGQLFTLADTAFAYACNSQGLAAVASAASIDFLRPAFAGDRLVATARVKQQGKLTGDADLLIAGGVESMSRAPFVMGKASAPYQRQAELFDTTIGWRFVNPLMAQHFGTDSMPETAENVAELLNISRADQDAFAWRSQQRTAQAQRDGILAQEIVPVQIVGRKGAVSDVREDEHPRPETTLEQLAKLKAPFRQGGVITAGNASGVNDGAAALIIASEQQAAIQGLTPRARIVAMATAGVEPRLMGLGPVPAVRKVLERAGLNINDMDLIELNEAFAAQALGVLRQLGVPDDAAHVNPNGGAIALGHPLGMSGARLALSASLELQRRGGRYALCTMCIGVGQGIAMILERV